MKITTIPFLAKKLPNILPTTWHGLVNFCNQNDYNISESDFEKLQNHAKSLLPKNIKQAATELAQSNDKVIQQLLKNYLIQLGDAGDFNAYIALLNVPYLQKNDSKFLEDIFEKLYKFLISKITTETQDFLLAKANDRSTDNEADSENQYIAITKKILRLIENIEKIRENSKLAIEIVFQLPKTHPLIEEILGDCNNLLVTVFNNRNIFSQDNTLPSHYKTLFTLCCILAEYSSNFIKVAMKDQNIITRTAIKSLSFSVNIPEEVKNHLSNIATLPVINNIGKEISTLLEQILPLQTHQDASQLKLQFTSLKKHQENISSKISLFINASNLLSQFPHLYQLASLENNPEIFKNKSLELENQIQDMEKQVNELELASQMNQKETGQAANSSALTKNTTKNESNKPTASSFLDASLKIVKNLFKSTSSSIHESLTSSKGKGGELTQNSTKAEASSGTDEKPQNLMEKEDMSKFMTHNSLLKTFKSIGEKLEFIKSHTSLLKIKATDPQSIINYEDINKWLEHEENIKKLEVEFNHALEAKKRLRATMSIQDMQYINKKIPYCKEALAATKDHCTAFDRRLSSDQLDAELAMKQEIKKNHQARSELANKHITILDKYHSQRKHDYYHYDNIAKIGVFFARCFKPEYQTDKKERKTYIEKVKIALKKYAKTGNKEDLLKVINAQQFKSRTDDKNSPTYQLTLQHVVDQLKKDLGIDIISHLEPDSRPNVFPA